MEHFHGSHNPLSQIHGEGVFGGIFAASSEAAALSHGPLLHRITSPRPLTDYELNYSIDEAWDIAVKVARGNEAIAECIMSRDCPSLDSCEPENASEQGWEFQRLRGVLASKLGFTSVEMSDEHGTSWLCLPGCVVEQLI
ncbi:hypothetical protein [Pseudomonas ovata]|uniref:hypothetical protein n=1 Tax=Pseudomonas ovata TaxID=1839709 RepID=UPI000D698CB4|nr:hypothetical protein [Pseudomonas ovata]